jgi:isopenicillin N synthase-like dioxygenase
MTDVTKNEAVASVDPAVSSSTLPRREAVHSLPVIDVSPFVSNTDPTARSRVAKQVRKACIDVGFFYLSGHGIPTEELNEAITSSRKFFELPLDVKMRYSPTGPAQSGFVRVGGINPDANAERNADLKERFVLAREIAETRESAGIGAKSLSRWPSDDILPGFTAFMTRHLKKRIALSQALARAFALSLDLSETYFEPLFKSEWVRVSLDQRS